MSSPLEAVLKRNASNPHTNRAIRKEAQERIIRPGVSGFRRLWNLDFSDSTKTSLRMMVAPVSGFIAAFAEICVTFPTEYCKVQLQLNRTNPSFSIKDHLLERRFKIYQGLPPMLIGAPLQGLLRFASLDLINHKLDAINSSFPNPVLQSGAFKGVVAGILAGTVESVLVVTPMETIKTKLIDSKKGLIEGTRYVVQKQGLRGLYNGLGATVAKSASNQAIRFVVFNEYKTLMLAGRESKSLSPLESLGGGVLAGLIGCLLNTPFDTVKSRMQGLEASRYNGMVHCAKLMVKEEGVASLYRGLLWRAARVVPGQGIIFFVYEQCSSSLHKKLA